jgi:hypothetical protein
MEGGWSPTRRYFVHDARHDDPDRHEKQQLPDAPRGRGRARCQRLDRAPTRRQRLAAE